MAVDVTWWWEAAALQAVATAAPASAAPTRIVAAATVATVVKVVKVVVTEAVWVAVRRRYGDTNVGHVPVRHRCRWTATHTTPTWTRRWRVSPQVLVGLVTPQVRIQVPAQTQTQTQTQI